MSVKQVSGFCPFLREAVQEFLLDQEISNRAKGTIEAQRTVLGFMVDYAEAQEWPRVSAIGKSHLRQYLASIKGRPRWFGQRPGSERPISDAYYETNYRRIKRFFNWCLVEGYVNQNPLAQISHPKIPTRVIPTVSDDDFKKLLRLTDPGIYPTPGRKFRAYRDQAVVWVLKDTPGRKQEIARLTTETVDLRERRVLVEGKGRKERYMYLGTVTTKAMAQYKLRRDALNPLTNAWWVDVQGMEMQDDWLYRMLKRLCDRAGIPRIHPHQFRHTFAVGMIEADVPLPTLEVMGGWSRIPQTYLATLGDKAAKAAHRRVSPADRLAGRK